jgi:hypothetical protein
MLLSFGKALSEELNKYLPISGGFRLGRRWGLGKSGALSIVAQRRWRLLAVLCVTIRIQPKRKILLSVPVPARMLNPFF